MRFRLGLVLVASIFLCLVGASGCSSNSCADDDCGIVAPICSPNSSWCSGGMVETCDSTGWHHTPSTCPDGTACNYLGDGRAECRSVERFDAGAHDAMAVPRP
jgi:hypothetical protein